MGSINWNGTSKPLARALRSCSEFRARRSRPAGNAEFFSAAPASQTDLSLVHWYTEANQTREAAEFASRVLAMRDGRPVNS